MIKVTIKTQETITNQALFTSLEEAEVWVRQHQKEGNFPVGFEAVFDELLVDSEQSKTNLEAQQFLDSTDWMVVRHRDQQDMGITPSMTGEEFQELLRKRQMAREVIIK